MRSIASRDARTRSLAMPRRSRLVEAQFQIKGHLKPCDEGMAWRPSSFIKSFFFHARCVVFLDLYMSHLGHLGVHCRVHPLDGHRKPVKATFGFA